MIKKQTKKDLQQMATLGILLVLMTTLVACRNSGTVETAVPPAAPTKTSPTTPTEPPLDANAPAVTAEAGDTTPTLDVQPSPESPASSDSTALALDEDYPDASPVFMQLVVGTMVLEATPNGVTAEQAQELLPLWQMFRAVRRGDAPPSLEEIEAITGQIAAVMSPEQLGAIKNMQITQDDVRAFTQENKIPQSGQGSGGGQMGSGGGDTQDLSPEERRMRMIMGGGKNLVDELIRRLEMWAG
jgi:hypothetical protein